jgi:hypothetical protein
VEHFQELIPEEDPEEIEGMSDVDDDQGVCIARLSRIL